ncbi:hypothetical protein TH53_20025 [Pedobacter lusitanus]|uniref:Radical SAM core domain-containing protein n=2 Tax=Pedobacter lusitanus TaxID=1503925 RepID=A0A0D0GHD7_9SPHI|nr:hypothetical protein TH53_20025 [Pedobacter lusitanus]
MYNLGDQTYLKQPKFMSLETVTVLAERLKSYCKNAGIDYVQIVFHGGEPLLLSKEYFKTCINLFRETSPEIEFGFTIQTNGVTIDKEWYDLFKANNVGIGISIDGPKKYHDEFRVFHNGKGSYNQVAKAVKLGGDNGLLGILMVMNTGIPTSEFYQELKDLKIGNLNLLLPDGHYDKLPDGFDTARFGDDDYTPYADWLIELFQIWKSDKQRPTIRFFETLIEMIAGEENIGNQAFGKKKNGVVVIETDGGIEVVDSLRACYEGITRNELNIHKNQIEDLFQDNIFEVYYNAHDMVCEKCLNCPVYDFCGGGFLGSRYANHNGFDNPTIYCKDIIRILSFIQNDILDSLPAEVTNRMGVEKLSYEELLQEIEKPALIQIDNEVKQKLISFKQPDIVCT